MKLWLTLAEFARAMGKSYSNVSKLRRHGALNSRGLRFFHVFRPQGRCWIWVEIDEELLDRLVHRESDPLHSP